MWRFYAFFPFCVLELGAKKNPHPKTLGVGQATQRRDVAARFASNVSGVCVVIARGANRWKGAENVSENGQHGERQVAKNAAIFAAFTLLSRLVALVRDLVISHHFGATRITDAYLTAFTIPNVLRRLVAEGGVTVAVIPIYTSVRQDEGDAAARRFLAASLAICLVGVGAMTLLGIAGARALVYAFASGFADEPEVFELAVELTRWMFPYIYCISLVGLAMGALNARGHFAAPAAAPALLNVAIVLSVLLFRDAFEQPIFSVATGVLAGGVAQLLLQIPALAKHGLLVAPSFQWKSPAVRRLMRALAPALFGLGVYQINIVILRQLGSYLPEGQLTYYYNADRLAEFALGVFGIAIASATLPALSEKAARGDFDGLLATWRHSLGLTSFIIIPSAAGLAAIAFPIVSVLYLHGEFTLADAQWTAWATIAFAPWLVTTALVRTTVQVFYAVEDMKTPVRVAAVVMTANFILGVVLLRYEVVGLAASLALSSLLQFVLLLTLVRRRFGVLGFGTMCRQWARQGALTAVSVSSAWGVSRWADFEAGATAENIVVLAMSIGCAVALYGGAALLLNWEEARVARSRILGRLSRRARRSS